MRAVLGTVAIIAACCLTTWSIFFGFSYQVLAQENTNPNTAAEQKSQQNFATKLHTTLNVTDLGASAVKHEISITNKTPTQFPTKFALRFNSPEISDIKTSIDDVPMEANIAATDKEISIGLTLPNKNVGEGKTTKIVIEYLDPQASHITGQVLFVNWPKLLTAGEFDTQTLTMITPAKFGDPSQISPQPTQTYHLNDSIISTFANLSGESMAAIFGSEQVFKFKMTYHLNNTNSTPLLNQLVVPPDSPTQKIVFTSINPPADSWTSDADGNWLISYGTKPQENKQVVVEGYVKLTTQPDANIEVTQPIKQHLKPLDFWQISDNNLTQAKLKNSNPRDIYKQVLELLEFDFAQPKLAELTTTPANNEARLGAEKVLKNPNHAKANEFNDLLIGAFRANGIPARRVVGWAYSADTKYLPLAWEEANLHVWSQHYANGHWQSSDPTHEEVLAITKYEQADLSHVDIAYNGISSSNPSLIGPDKPKLTLEFSLDQNFPKSEAQVSAQVEPTQPFGLPVPGFYTLQLKNISGSAFHNFQVSAQQSQAKIYFQSDQLMILPFEEKEIKLIAFSKFLTSGTEDVKLTLGDQTYQTTISTGPAFFYLFTKKGSLIAVGIFGAISTIAAGSLLVLRQRRQRPVRRKS